MEEIFDSDPEEADKDLAEYSEGIRQTLNKARDSISRCDSVMGASVEPPRRS
jgi:hypothetical protein